MAYRDMRTFVINLAERTDRMELFKENKFPFEVERFEAIKTDPGWIGCTQSHFSILQKQIERPILILEDDVVLIQTWSVVIEAMKQLPKDWDMLWLGGTFCIPLERYSENLFIAKGILTAHAIIYNSERVINYIIENHVGFFSQISNRKTIDVFYCDDVQDKFKCFIVYPFVATQRAGFSDIEKSGQDYTMIINNLNLPGNASNT